ncbi:hypothetical protein NDU88_002493 [Pleurodeles waltl]|uniref:Uncharacterized protein n=1 Tax=Pleurodeles waltl TaxID=8319 RepID=A0AAV7UVR8_PLEWA|nr:hypothetical protein NDU88_002493 [Pleurodeles waltl]
MQEQKMKRPQQDQWPGPGPPDPAAKKGKDTAGREAAHRRPDGPKNSCEASPQDENGTRRGAATPPFDPIITAAPLNLTAISDGPGCSVDLIPTKFKDELLIPLTIPPKTP